MSETYTLITGASAGLGLEMARLLAAQGRNLLLLARRVDRLTAIATELRQKGAGLVRTCVVDLADERALDEFVDEIQRDGLCIDTLINNAGFGLRGAFIDLDTEAQLSCLQVNIRALTWLTRTLLPAMKERGQGAILNVASTAAFQPGPGMAVYYATKAYVLSLTEALAEELRPHGIRVTCLCPGPTHTEFAEIAGMADSKIFEMGAMDATVVARRGLAALDRGRVLELPGPRNKFLVFLLRFVPRSWVRKIVAKLQ